MRTFLTTLLTALILACPFVCGAGEACEGSHRHSEDGNNSAPVHCPEDSDNCICRGAVQATDVRVPHSDILAPTFFPVWVVGCLAHTLTHPLIHLTIDGTPTGLAGWGGSLTVRAILQNFRC